MDFVIPAGSNANLPKELVDKIVENAVESSVIVKLINNRAQLLYVRGEGTIPVIGAESLDKFYRLDSTADITALTEQSMTIKTPDLNPKEIGTFIYLKTNDLKQLPSLNLDQLFERRLSRGMARCIEVLALSGNTDLGGATNPLTICNGIYTIANSSALCANTPITFVEATSADIMDAVADGLDAIGEYGNEDQIDDLFLFGSSAFMSAARKSASKDVYGYTIEPCAELGLQKVIHIHGIPVIRRTNVAQTRAVLVNMAGAVAGYRDNIGMDIEHKAGRRSDLYVSSYWIDFKWSLLSDDNKAEGLVLIRLASS